MPCPARPQIRITHRKINSRLPSPSGFAIGALPIARRSTKGRSSSDARVAQLVEHMTENHGVGGSIPSPGTICIKLLIINDFLKYRFGIELNIPAYDPGARVTKYNLYFYC